MMVKSMKYNGENWEDILYFLKGVGEYRTVLESDGDTFESSMYVYLSDGEATILNVNDYVAYVDDDIVIFSERDWIRFNRPSYLIEYERVLNLVFPASEIGTNVFELVGEITGYDVKPYGNRCVWILGDRVFEVKAND